MQHQRIFCLYCMEEISDSVSACPHCGFDPSNPPKPEFGDIDKTYHNTSPRKLVLSEANSARFFVGCFLRSDYFGNTFSGYDLVNHRKVLLKEMSFPLLSKRDNETGYHEIFEYDRETFHAAVQDTLESAAILMKCPPMPHMEQVHGVFEDNNTVYLVTEYCNDPILQPLNLHDFSSEQSLSIAAWKLLKPIFGLVTELHRRRIIHGNLHPDCLRYNPETKQLTLTNFGTQAAARTLRTNATRSHLPFSATRCPFEFLRSDYDGKNPYTDVFWMGVIFHYTVTGIALPGSWDSLSLTDPYDDFPRRCGIWPPHLMAILSKATSWSWMDRIRMQEFTRLLDQAIFPPVG